LQSQRILDTDCNCFAFILTFHMHTTEDDITRKITKFMNVLHLQILF